MRFFMLCKMSGSKFAPGQPCSRYPEANIRISKWKPNEVFSAIRRELTQRIEPPNLDFVFSLIGVVLPREPVRAAFEGLTTKDQQLRGLALEYLESALPRRYR